MTQKRTNTQMRKLHDKHNIKPSLLSIPTSDFPSIKNSSKMGVTQQPHTTLVPPIVSNDEDQKLLLLQLPASLKVEDILFKSNNGQQQANIIVNKSFSPSDSHQKPMPNNSSITNENNGNECNLILEEKGMTFGLIRAETSNSYILVPPSNVDDAAIPPAKKTKRLPTTTSGETKEELMPMKARLLSENSTFFLECVPHYNDMKWRRRRMAAICKLLSQCVYSPQEDNDSWEGDRNNKNRDGFTITELSIQLSCSRKEIQTLLQSVDRVFPFPQLSSKDEQRYGSLSEEVEQNSLMNIVHTLTEWEGGFDYFKKGIIWEDMVMEVLKRGEDEISECIEAVVRYCLCKLRLDDTHEKEETCVKLDVNKIAIFIAHYLFISQTKPWEQSVFLSEWNRLMPGVGILYEPKIELLKGVALIASNVDPETLEKSKKAMEYSVTGKGESSLVHLKYFPRESLPLDAYERFKALFKEQSTWTLNDLEPYLETLVSFGEESVTDLLLKYTYAFEDKDRSARLYMEKK